MTSKESENKIREFITDQDLSTLENTEKAMLFAMRLCMTIEDRGETGPPPFTIHETMTALTILSSFRDGHLRNR